MLNKQICKKCCNALEDEANQWHVQDDKQWKKGYVICYVIDKTGSRGRQASIKRKRAPKWCKYALEHLVCQKV